MNSEFIRLFLFVQLLEIELEQGRIHGNPVAEGWAGAIMQKPLAILEIFWTDGRTDGLTDTARCRVACPQLKSDEHVLFSDSTLERS